MEVTCVTYYKTWYIDWCFELMSVGVALMPSGVCLCSLLVTKEVHTQIKYEQKYSQQCAQLSESGLVVQPKLFISILYCIPTYFKNQKSIAKIYICLVGLYQYSFPFCPFAKFPIPHLKFAFTFKVAVPPIHGLRAYGCLLDIWIHGINTADQ